MNPFEVERSSLVVPLRRCLLQVAPIISATFDCPRCFDDANVCEVIAAKAGEMHVARRAHRCRDWF